MVAHQRTHHTQDLHYNIPSDWVIQNSLSGYMGRDAWHKFMFHFASLCFSYPLNPQVLFYDVYDSSFDDRELETLHKHNIQSFILKAGDVEICILEIDTLHQSML